MVLEYGTFFRELTGFIPYRYQRRTAAILLGGKNAVQAGLQQEVDFLEGDSRVQLREGGKNILLCAPTGSGKTWAVLVPFVFSRMQGKPIADRVFYALPLRSLADDLYQSTKERLERAGILSSCPVRLQTGETSGIQGIGDPTFSEGRVIFCTIDQLLSSYLNIPFSLSARLANLNSGALVGSVIIFDEHHLLDPNRSLMTALLLTRHLAGLARFVWMTATQAEAARNRFLAKDRLDAAPVQVSQSELANMPSQCGRKRKWFWSICPLSAQMVLEVHEGLDPERRRTLVVANTVSRAQRLYREIKNLAGARIPTHLIHSRFLPDHRKEKINRIRRLFGRGSYEEGILVSTQVVEAGLDISATCLHTELAPASALIQRAGRCARFEGETGNVFVYDALEKNGTRSYHPYSRMNSRKKEDVMETGFSEETPTLCHAIDRTAVELSKVSGQYLSFSDELSLIDLVHTDIDLNSVDAFDEIEWRRTAADAMMSKSDLSNYEKAGNLIRDIDSVSILLADEERLSNSATRLDPYYALTISIPRASLAAQSKIASNTLPLGVWALKAPIYCESENGYRFERYETVAKIGEGYQSWLIATYRGMPLVLNPLLGRYTCESGLELGVASMPSDWQSTGTISDEDPMPMSTPVMRYRAETYRDHTTRVYHHAVLLCYGDSEDREPTWYRTQQDPFTASAIGTDCWTGLKLIDARFHLPPGTAKNLVIWASMLHDCGKLTKEWQEAAWRWEERKASQREHYPSTSSDNKRFLAAQQLVRKRKEGSSVLLAHTDYDGKWHWPNGRNEADIEREFRRPNHALQGAWLAMPIVAERVDHTDLPAEQLAKVVLFAISQHHSATTGWSHVNRSVPLFSPDIDQGSQEAIRHILPTRCGLFVEKPTYGDWENFLKNNIQFHLKPGPSQQDALDDWIWWPVAMLCTRIVRLSDQFGTRMGVLTGTDGE